MEGIFNEYDAAGIPAVCEAEGPQVAAAEGYGPGLCSGRGHLRGGPADPERLDCRRPGGKDGGHRHLLHAGVSLRPADGAEPVQQAGPLWRRRDAGAHHRLCQRGGLTGHRLPQRGLTYNRHTVGSIE